jgi:hypothetical protein
MTIIVKISENSFCPVNGRTREELGRVLKKEGQFARQKQ